jgi:hypothetical protein
MLDITLYFTRERETKNTVRFKEDSPKGVPPVVGTLYVRKEVAKGAMELQVTIKSKEEPK